MAFSLDNRLAKDCIILGDLKLCKLLLMNDSQYPWLILVPRRSSVREIFQLNPEDQMSLMTESNLIAQTLQKVFNPDKLNTAAIGNMVPQLHIHHIARFTNDIAWPAPVWGAKPAAPYSKDKLMKVSREIKEPLTDYFN
ncbi:MAG: HIT family protein [Zetaproteobacteria bacterium]|nr:HIT family protein [Pseudobdellovibrionaceae bacterium]